jgi:cell division septum initiation protein DivIVA
LTLPLIAGACFSAGWRHVKDTHRYRQLKKEIKKLEQKLESVSNSLHTAVSAIESAKTWLAFDEKASDPDAETLQELNLYRHGYLRGVNVPETIDHGLSLYERVQRSAQKIIAKKLKERIWSDV